MLWSCPKFVKYLYAPKNRCYQLTPELQRLLVIKLAVGEKIPCTTIITRWTGNFQAPAEILPTPANLILARSVDALRMEIVASATTERWFSVIRTLTTPRLNNLTCGILTGQPLTVGVASISLRKRVRASSQYQENRGLRKKNFCPHQFLQAQHLSGRQHP